MKREKKTIGLIGGIAVSTAMLLSACGTGNDMPEKASTINAQTNGDGNYNVLFITTDQEHYFAEYPKGSDYKARQLLEELGTTFEKHYACSNMSTSSRSVIYTGTHITDTKMLDNTDFDWQGALSEDLTTIADRMNSIGYYSAYKGKWHMGNSSIFHEVKDPLTSLEGYGFRDWGGTDYIGETWEGYQKDPVIVSDTNKWLEETGQKINEEGQSFFLSVNLINPHDVMDFATEEGFSSDELHLEGAPESKLYQKTYDAELPSNWNQNLLEGDAVNALKSYKMRWESRAGKITDEESAKSLQNYYFNCIQDSDNSMMELLTKLQDLGMLDNTIIIFTADHGEMQGAHGLKGKGGFVYENNIHVPLVIYHPEIEGGRHIEAVTSHMDIAPTIIDMTNVRDADKQKASEGLAGHSLKALMLGEDASVRDGSLFCYEMLSFTAETTTDDTGESHYEIDNRNFVRALITDRYKFARYFSPKDFNTPQTYEELIAHNDVELYDLENDPDEMVNLALDPANKELVMEMNARMNQVIQEEIGEDDGSEFREQIQNYVERVKEMRGE